MYKSKEMGLRNKKNTNGCFLQFLDWSIKQSGIRAVITQFWSVDRGQPSALIMGQQAPAIQLQIANALRAVWFCSGVAMSSFCHGICRLPLGNQCPVEGAAYFFILKYSISLLSAGTPDSLAKSLAIRTGGHLGSQAVRHLSCSLFFQWVLPGSLVRSAPSSCAGGAGSGR